MCINQVRSNAGFSYYCCYCCCCCCIVCTSRVHKSKSGSTASLRLCCFSRSSARRNERKRRRRCCRFIVYATRNATQGETQTPAQLVMHTDIQRTTIIKIYPREEKQDDWVHIRNHVLCASRSRERPIGEHVQTGRFQLHSYLQ